jgi:hypothetical protein
MSSQPPAGVLNLPACASWIEHSDDESRLALMLGSYYDESAVDGGGPVSCIGGLLLNHRGYTWLEIEWNNAVSESGIGKPYIHMKDFGEHGELANFPVASRERLFSRLSKIINSNKDFSVGSSLTPEEYKAQFFALTKRTRRKKDGDQRMSIHSACFLQAVVCQAKWAEAQGYTYDIPFMLDAGCPDRRDIDLAHAFLVNEFSAYQPPFPTHVGGLTWEDDKNFPQLQAADVVAWAVRRKASKSPFNRGYGPLLDILDEERHIDSHFKKEWMEEVSTALHAKLGR